jgi:hypothetical protein
LQNEIAAQKEKGVPWTDKSDTDSTGRDAIAIPAPLTVPIDDIREEKGDKIVVAIAEVV